MTMPSIINTRTMHDTSQSGIKFPFAVHCGANCTWTVEIMGLVSIVSIEFKLSYNNHINLMVPGQDESPHNGMQS